MKKLLSIILLGSSILYSSVSYAEDINKVGQTLTEEQKKIIESKIQTLPEKQKDALEAKYIYGDGEKINNWHFVYGPFGKNYKIKTLKFYALAPNGAAEFVCNSQGEVSLLFSLIQYDKPKIGEVVPINVMIGNKSHKLASLVQHTDNKDDHVYYQADGSDVIGILTVINKLVYNELSTSDIVFQSDNRFLKFPAPNVDGDSAATLGLCKKWSDNHFNSIKVH